MVWNWELPEWPQFSYEKKLIALQEKEFLLKAGNASAYLKSIEEHEYNRFVVEILSNEGVESSKIEGEILDRESLQASIKRHFGIKQGRSAKIGDKESRMADLLCNVYSTFDKPLTHEMLWEWHVRLFEGSSQIDDHGSYRSHNEPMQIVSTRYGKEQIFFEAPPSKAVLEEMEKFIEWFNNSKDSEQVLGRAAIAHVYFECIHPFEDGNGRIGRLLVEKVLSQGAERPILVAVSRVLEKERKKYYSALEKCNRTLTVSDWVVFFAHAIAQAQADSIHLLNFLIEKAKMFQRLLGQLNERQEKVLLRLFAEGPSGFDGGLSAENYIAITKTSRATATRDLNDLVEMKAIVKSGELKHTRYRLNITPRA